jgi:hypothetical protein
VKIVLISLLVVFGVVSWMEDTEYQHRGYIQGCADVMKGLYEGMGITKIDTKSLNSFCEEKWGDRK